MTRSQKIIHVLTIGVSVAVGTAICMAQGHHGWLLAVAAGVNLISAALVMELLERTPVFWRLTGIATRTKQMSLSVNLPRRPHERLMDWEHRVEMAHCELGDAMSVFLEAAQQDGFMVRVGQVEQWMLPITHPAAIRLAKARNEPAVVLTGSPYRGTVPLAQARAMVL